MENWFLLDRAFEKLKHALLETQKMIERGKWETGFYHFSKIHTFLG